jgi:hypothetical protein
MLAYITGTVDQELLVRNEYLAAENRILKAQIKGRLLLSEADKATLAEIAHRLGRKALEEVAATAMPHTILGWYRKLVANKFDGSRFRHSAGRPRVDEETEGLVVQMAKEDPTWGYDRIVDALANLGQRLSDQTVGNILRRHGVPSRLQTKTHDQLERLHPRSYGCSGGNGFLHGGSAYAQRLGYLLRVVLYPVGESEGLSGRNHAPMVKKLIFASKEGEFTRPKAHAASRS